MSHQEIDKKNRMLSPEVAFAASHYTRERDYWVNKFSGNLEKSNFPCKPGTKPGPGARKAALECKLEGEPFARLMKLSGATHTRLHMILVGAVALLLHKYTGNSHISIGTPIYTPEVEGEFINTVLPLRIPVDSCATFKKLLNETRQTVIEAVRHVNYPIEKLLYQLNLPYSREEFPLFDIALLLENIQHERYIDHLPLRMLISFLNTGTSVQCTFKYDASIYEEALIHQLTDHFRTLLANALVRVDSPLADIEILSREEKKYLLFALNDTETAYADDQTIHGLIRDQVQETPDQTAINYKNNYLSYNELNKRSHRFMRFLKTKGISAGSTVALLMDPHPEVPLVILAILKMGGAYLPLDPDYPPGRIQYIIKDSNTRHMVTNRSEVDPDNFPISIIRSDAPGNDPYRQEIPGEDGDRVLPVDLAYIMYTSGSTGTPKGVMVEHRGVVNYLTWGKKIYLEGKRYHFPLYSSLAFDLTVTSLFLPLISGNMLVIYKQEKHENVICRVIEEKKIHVLKLTPTHLKIITTQDTHFNSAIKKLIVGGEELTASLAKEIYKKFNGKVEIYNEYGPTETVVGCMIYKFDPREDNMKSVPIGVPLENTHIYLLDRDRSPVPRGAEGEIYISGAGTARGYLNNQELTRHHFMHDPFRTGKRMYRSGDLARLLPNGNMIFMGRSDNQLKIRGYRIEPAEIENRLMQRKEIGDALVVVREHTTGDNYLTAYLVPAEKKPGQKLAIDVNELRNDLSRVLPAYMIPTYFVLLDQFPLTPNSKIDRKALPQPVFTPGSSSTYHPPRTRVEKQLVEIWSLILGIESRQIGLDCNFFQLGGHSLNATALVSQMQKKFNIRITLADIFQRPTVRELAELVNNSVKEQFIPIVPLAKKDYYPLSPAQKRLYILQQMEKTNIGYNMPFVTILEGNPEVNTLERSFQQLVHRHESFRTQFIMVNQEPVQVILESGAVDFHVDVYEAGEKEVDAILREHAKPFDLTRTPLLRVDLIKLLHTPGTPGSRPAQEEKEHRYLLLVDMHHIISDGLAMDIFIHEFMSLYEGQELPPLKVQYKDYSGWQNRDEQQNRLKRQEKYWLKELQGDIPVLELPYDYMRPTLKSFAGKSMPFTLARSTSEALKAMAFQYDVTQFMLLFACFTIMLYKISGQDDIVIGTPVAGRKHTDLEPIIGIFINSLAIRSKVIPVFRFSDFLHYIKEKTLESFENQDYPFEDLVEKVSPRRDTSRNPLFDVLFTYYSQDLDYNVTDREMLDIDLGGVKLKKYEYDYPVSKLDITLHTLEKADHFLFLFEYCTRLFNRETIERFAGYLTRVIQAVVEAPRTRISQIEILPPEEKRQLLYEFNDTDFDYDRDITIHEKFADQVEKDPDRSALTGKIVITYRELQERSGQLAYALKEKGVGPDSVVAIMMERSTEMMTGIFAILTAGGAYLPIDPDYPEKRVNYMLADSGAQILLVTKDAVGLQEQVIRQINMSDRTYMSYPSYSPQPQPTTSLAYVIYTSGSTGRPKGVMIRHYSVINRLNWMQRCYPLGEKDVILQKTPVVFDVSVWELFWWSFQGSGLCLLEAGGEKNPAAIIAAIKKENVTTMHFVPSMLSAFLEYVEKSPGFNRGKGLTGLRRVFSSGEVLAPHLVVRFNKLIGKPFGVKLINLYGPTEATVDVSYFDCPAGEEELPVIPIGKPIDNTQLLILGISSHLQSIGITGELCIAGEGLARGYLNQPELTAEKFCSITPGYYRSYKSNRSYNTYQSYKIYHTGDIARWLPGGNIEFLGRMDHQVKIRGFRIELEEIASRLANLEDIKEAVVKDYIKQEGQGYLCGYFTADREIPVDEIKQYLLRFLPGYMVPAYFVQMEAMPLTPNGKIDRTQLPPPEVKSHALSRIPRSENEKIVYRLWSEVLPGRQVGIDDSFFSLGGSSIDVIKIAARLTGIFQREIPPLVLFEYPTIRLLSQYLTRSAAHGSAAAPAIDDNSEDRQEALEEAVQLFEET